MYFVGIGAQRAGTTWLWRILQSHPQVAFSPIKELHYFSRKYLGSLDADYRRAARDSLLKLLAKHRSGELSIRNALRIRMLARWFSMNDDQAYVRYFESLRHHTGKRCVGEITPLYSLLPKEGFENVLQLHEDARFLFLMRNPADRIASNATMGAQSPDDLLRFAATDPVRLRTDYHRTLEQLLSVVSRSQVHVEFYETLCHPVQQQAAFRRLFEFLDLAWDELPQDATQETKRSRGEQASVDPLLRQQLVRQFQHVYEFARDFMGGVPESWERDLTLLSVSHTR